MFICGFLPGSKIETERVWQWMVSVIFPFKCSVVNMVNGEFSVNAIKLF